VYPDSILKIMNHATCQLARLPSSSPPAYRQRAETRRGGRTNERTKGTEGRDVDRNKYRLSGAVVERLGQASQWEIILLRKEQSWGKAGSIVERTGQTWGKRTPVQESVSSPRSAHLMLRRYNWASENPFNVVSPMP
jgi:hypothetical protein